MYMCIYGSVPLIRVHVVPMASGRLSAPLGYRLPRGSYYYWLYVDWAAGQAAGRQGAVLAVQRAAPYQLCL